VALTKLGQKPKLGGVRILTDISFRYHSFITFVGVPHFLCISVFAFIFPSFVCLKNFENTKIYFPLLFGFSFLLLVSS
jgi:hypothetical protein